MMPAFTLIALLMLLPIPALAFNTFQLLDPAFQHFVIIETPLMAVILGTILDSLCLYPIIKKQPLSMNTIVWRLLRLNLHTIYVALVLGGVVLLFVAPTILETAHPLPLQVAAIWFSLGFMWIGWDIKQRALLKHYQLPVNQLKQSLILPTILTFSVFYWRLYTGIIG